MLAYVVLDNTKTNNIKLAQPAFHHVLNVLVQLFVLNVPQTKFFKGPYAWMIVQWDTIIIASHVINVPLVALIVSLPLYVLNALLDSSNPLKEIVYLAAKWVNLWSLEYVRIVRLAVGNVLLLFPV